MGGRFKGKWTGPDGCPSPTFQQQLYSFTAVDYSSKFVFSRLCCNILSVTAHLEALRIFALESNRIIRYIRTDNKFITSSTTAWASSNKILFIPSIPHEHDTVRSVECVHRTLQEMVVKLLALKPHLSPSFWGLSYLHNVDILNIIPNATNVSPFYSWYSRPFDLQKTPLLPFGSIVAAHRPLATQHALSGRSIESIFVGIAHDYAGGIILFNPTTKRSVVRHSFKYLDDNDPISTSYVDLTILLFHLLPQSLLMILCPN